MTVKESIDISPSGDEGVLKKILKEGEGSEVPCAGCVVRVHYTGTLLDGTKFDSSKDRNEPFEFNLGKGSVIKAWDIGVATMKKGEVCLLTCAPEYAYGAAGSPPKIPPNATLQFEIEMISWQGEDLSPQKNNSIVRYTITAGSGYENPNDGALVNVELEGRLSGSTEPFEKRTLSFNLGEGSEVGVCSGIETALGKFAKGEKSRIVIQPKFAFKAEGNTQLNIPPNAVVEYIITLNSFEKAKEAWSMDAKEKIEQAKIYKEKGTNYFKASKHQLASKMYTRVVKLTEDENDEEYKQELKDLLLSAHLNLSLVYLKANTPHHTEAKEHAISALKLDPVNVKALFRRGQALLALGDADKAEADFQQVVELDPGNKAAANQIIICRDTIKKQKQKEKQLYANMFEKFAEKDREVKGGENSS